MKGSSTTRASLHLAELTPPRVLTEQPHLGAESHQTS